MAHAMNVGRRGFVAGSGKTVEEFNAATHYEADNVLSHTVKEGFEPLLHWLEDMGMPVNVSYDIATPFGGMADEQGNGGAAGPHNFFNQFVARYQEMGGWLLTQTRGTHLIVDDQGTVVGLQCVGADGETINIAAKAAILATGGFQSDPELKARYLGVDGHQVSCMGTPYNTGAGMKMAQEVGASLQGAFSQWAGAFVAAEPAKNPAEDVEVYEANDYTTEEGGKFWLYECMIDTIDGRVIWVNSDGERFVDENLPGNSSKPAVGRQRRAAAIIVCDAPVWEEWMATPAASLADTIADQMAIVTSDAVGGAYFQADTIEELADQLNAAGPATYMVHKGNLVKTIAEYNAAAEAGAGADLFPPKTGDGRCVPIATPPFYAFPVQAAPYATFGGEAIDENAQVLDLSRKPIAGHYATVPCAGGVFYEFYTGAIASAGITGRMAADAATWAIRG